MKNRLFRLLAGGILMAALVVVPGCGASPAAGDIIVTSTVVNGHSHQITVLSADIRAPPSEKTITSTSAGGHTHTVKLTTPDYTGISGGQTVTVTSSVDAGHSHDFTIVQSSGSGGGGGY